MTKAEISNLKLAVLLLAMLLGFVLQAAAQRGGHVACDACRPATIETS